LDAMDKDEGAQVLYRVLVLVPQGKNN